MSEENPSRRSSGGFSAPRGSGANNVPAVKKGYAGMRTSGANVPPATQSVDDAARAALARMGGAKAPPTGGVKTRRKFHASQVTPRQRMMLVLGAVACVIAAGVFTVFNPFAEKPEEEEAAAPQRPLAAEGGDTASAGDAANPAPGRPSSHKSAPVIRSGGSTRTRMEAELPPFKSAAHLASSEFGEQLKVIRTYMFEGSSQDRADAYRALLDQGDDLKAQLPTLIKDEDKIPLASYANAARELKLATAIDPVIAKLSTDIPIARVELFHVLVASDSPKARDYVWALLNRGDSSDGRIVWGIIGKYLTDKDADTVLKIVASNRADAGDAAAALGTYASHPAEASQLGHQIDELMRKPDVNKAALMRALTTMEPGSASFTLLGYASDPDERLRATALGALARDRSRYAMALNALRNDPSVAVKTECIRGFMQNQNDDALSECIKLLSDPALSNVAHQALVSANNQKDLGWHDFAWAGWLAARKTAKAGKS